MEEYLPYGKNRAAAKVDTKGTSMTGQSSITEDHLVYTLPRHGRGLSPAALEQLDQFESIPLVQLSAHKQQPRHALGEKQAADDIHTADREDIEEEEQEDEEEDLVQDKWTDVEHHNFLNQVESDFVDYLNFRRMAACSDLSHVDLFDCVDCVDRVDRRLIGLSDVDDLPRGGGGGGQGFQASKSAETSSAAAAVAGERLSDRGGESEGEMVSEDEENRKGGEGRMGRTRSLGFCYMGSQLEATEREWGGGSCESRTGEAHLASTNLVLDSLHMDGEALCEAVGRSGGGSEEQSGESEDVRDTFSEPNDFLCEPEAAAAVWGGKREEGEMEGEEGWEEGEEGDEIGWEEDCLDEESWPEGGEGEAGGEEEMEEGGEEEGNEEGEKREEGEEVEGEEYEEEEEEDEEDGDEFQEGQGTLAAYPHLQPSLPYSLILRFKGGLDGQERSSSIGRREVGVGMTVGSGEEVEVLRGGGLGCVGPRFREEREEECGYGAMVGEGEEWEREVEEREGEREKEWEGDRQGEWEGDREWEGEGEGEREREVGIVQPHFVDVALRRCEQGEVEWTWRKGGDCREEEMGEEEEEEEEMGREGEDAFRGQSAGGGEDGDSDDCGESRPGLARVLKRGRAESSNIVFLQESASRPGWVTVKRQKSLKEELNEIEEKMEATFEGSAAFAQSQPQEEQEETASILYRTSSHAGEGGQETFQENRSSRHGNQGAQVMPTEETPELRWAPQDDALGPSRGADVAEGCPHQQRHVVSGHYLAPLPAAGAAGAGAGAGAAADGADGRRGLVEDGVQREARGEVGVHVRGQNSRSRRRRGFVYVEDVSGQDAISRRRPRRTRSSGVDFDQMVPSV